VNRRPTEEINISRELKKGYHVPPFLFLLVAEGYSGLMKNVVNLNMFKGFKFRSEGMELCHIQYAEDTLCIGKAIVDNSLYKRIIKKVRDGICFEGQFFQKLFDWG